MITKVIAWILIAIITLIPGSIAFYLAADAKVTGSLYFGSILFTMLLFAAITLVNKNEKEL